MYIYLSACHLYVMSVSNTHTHIPGCGAGGVTAARRIALPKLQISPRQNRCEHHETERQGGSKTINI